MGAPLHLLDHPPLKVSNTFGELSSQNQDLVMSLMTLLWNTEPYDASDDALDHRSVSNDDLPPGLHVSPCSICFSHGLTGHVAMVKNTRGRGLPLTEEFFFTYYPNTLAVGLHSTFLDPEHTTTLCVVSIEPSLLTEPCQ